MGKPQRYVLDEPVRGERHHAIHGVIAYEFPAGEVTPKNEGEELVLEELAASGLATKAQGKFSIREEEQSASKETR